LGWGENVWQDLTFCIWVIEVELGVEESGTHLYYKMCSREECCRIFLDFYDNVFTPKMEEYKPVEF